MGRAAFMRVPVSEANDLNYLLHMNYLVIDVVILNFDKSCSKVLHDVMLYT
jgi:hypothetical protein